eukprot:TRINITY_DN37932_c0_g1_i1.p1 TRINITY_DN37932_c0_g1~~TRINITY_DN37932_c0_g1_i1.p1  ORF type:complete len:262 (+),score=32.21 TRINITY_DN37932_c0_g1_i1:23-808(+)
MIIALCTAIAAAELAKPASFRGHQYQIHTLLDKQIVNIVFESQNVASIDCPGHRCNGIFVDSGILYLTHSFGVTSHSLIDPERPSQTGSTTFPRNCKNDHVDQLTLSGKYLYVSCYNHASATHRVAVIEKGLKISETTHFELKGTASSLKNLTYHRDNLLVTLGEKTIVVHLKDLFGVDVAQHDEELPCSTMKQNVCESTPKCRFVPFKGCLEEIYAGQGVSKIKKCTFVGVFAVSVFALVYLMVGKEEDEDDEEEGKEEV